MKRFVTKLMVIASLLAAALTPLVPATVSAQTKSDVCAGVELTGGPANCADPADGPDVDSTVKLVINILSMIVGVAAVIMIIIGGFKYIISSGDSGNIGSAKNTILYAIIGLVIVLLAQVIVRFVLNKAGTKPEDSSSLHSLQINA